MASSGCELADFTAQGPQGCVLSRYGRFPSQQSRRTTLFRRASNQFVQVIGTCGRGVAGCLVQNFLLCTQRAALLLTRKGCG